MSVIFGVCLPKGAAVDKESLFRLAEITSRFGPDGTELLAHGRVGMGFQAFHTHDRSRLEQQPTLDSLGNILVFDGRLDNHAELTAREDILERDASDSVLILRLFARWGEEFFSRLVGDWALALWSAKDRALYLARDHAGSRTLFYTTGSDRTRWSTHIETLFAGRDFPDLDHEYMARFLSAQEISDLTPYKGIRAVPPAHYIVIREGQLTLRPHWRWIANTRISYRAEAEYDEHFLHLFEQAVRRRTGPGASVLAELSGGMDSPSIVCMSDKIVKEHSGNASLVDTVSYYDDTEPDWNERPYFTAVEAQRNKSGIHIDWSSLIPSYEPLVLADRIYPYPGGDRSSLDRSNLFEQSVETGRYRVILSGIGGDELLGGVPTPMPELADHLQRGRLLRLFTRAGEWCLANREPLIRMLFGTVVFTFNLYRGPRPDRSTIPPWLSSELRRICLDPRTSREKPSTLLRRSPSAINNGRVWWALLETLPHLAPELKGTYEYRYPYLDRDLVEFLHRVPREQLVGPGRRRLLMRRALKGLVPAEIIERRRKGYVSHAPLANLRNGQQEIENLFSSPLSADYGLVDRLGFLAAFRAELAGEQKWIGPLTKAIAVELWLRSLAESGVGFRMALTRQVPDSILPGESRANKLRANDSVTQR